MPIIFDAATNNSVNPGTSPLEWSHTCSGSDRILIVGVHTFDTFGVDIVSGVTYNGVAMTQVNQVSTPNGSRFVYLYILTNPASGTNTISVSFSGSNAVFGTSSSYRGAQSSGQPDSNGENSSDSTSSLQISTTVVLPNCWLVSVLTGLGTLSSGTVRTTGGNLTCIGDSAAVVGTGSQSLTWLGNPNSAAGIVVSIPPALYGGGALFAGI